jgi:HEAT repeat protein
MNQPFETDHLTSPALVTRALKLVGDELNNDEEYWRIVGTLHGRGGSEEFAVARDLVSSPAPIERALGCDILGQLGWGKPTFVDECVTLLIERLADSDLKVIASAAGALGHRRNARAIDPVLPLVDHPNSDIRFNVVLALSTHEERRATDALIHLSGDEDRDVRDWATFGLGTMCTADYPELREALRNRLAEDDAEIRAEAMAGLALRKDAAVIAAIKAALEQQPVIAGVLDAAATTASPVLLAPLIALAARVPPTDTGYWARCLRDAIDACRDRKP